eukprot:TRINITY_DN409_c1_g2_i2.p1 TRINITY_DN409_c1_g2~~TRINITY_DN409_c1_g2_i2.p1  ORF type:complete len:882 (+),score=190.68 TRINITY_DN409_c1_g2_i2:1959-4604(+)
MFLFEKSVFLSNLNQELIQPCIQILEKAQSQNTPSVHHIQMETSLPTWSIHNFVTEIHGILNDLNSKLQPTLCFSEDANNASFGIYSQEECPVQVLLVNKDRYLFAIIGGSLNLQPNERIYSGEDFMLYNHIKNGEGEIVFQRNCFVMITIQSSSLNLYTYNWNLNRIEQLHAFTNKLRSWGSMRNHLLSNIVHQKLGLFHHSPPLPLVRLPVVNHSSAPSIPPPLFSYSKQLSTSSQFSASSSSLLTSTPEVVKYTLDDMEILLNHASPNRGGNEQNNPPQKTNAKSKRSLIPFQTVLYGHYPIDPLHVSSFSKISDPVKQHGMQFKAVANYTSYLFDYRSSLHNVFHLCSKLHSTISMASPLPQTISQNFTNLLVLIMKSSKILESFRMPFMMNTSSSFVTLKIEDKNNQTDLEWFKSNIYLYLDEYSKHLEHLGFYRLKTPEVTVTNWLFVHQIIEKDIIQLTQERYFIKPVRGGLILLRLIFDGSGTVCLESFGLFKSIPQHQVNIIRRAPPTIKEEFESLKPLISFKTSLFDFHTRRIHLYLERMSNLSKENAANLIPKSTLFSLLGALRTSQFRTFQPQNLIIFQKESISLPQFVTNIQLFSYLCKNATHFGFQFNEEVPSIISQLIDLKILQSKGYTSSSEDFRYSLVIVPSFSSDSTHEFRFEVYILRVYFPRPSFDISPQTRSQSPPLESEASIEITKEQLKIIASKHLKETIEKAFSEYHRDQLWKSLSSATHAEETHLSMEQLNQWKTLVYRRRIEEIDPSLTNLLTLNANWSSLLHHLHSVYGRFALLLSSKEKETNLMLFHHEDPDLLLHIAVDDSQNKIQIYACRRTLEEVETGSSKQHSPSQVENIECNQISNLVNHVIHFLWKGL